VSDGARSVLASLRELRAVLGAADPGQARFEAELLLRRVLDCSRAWLIAHGEDAIPDAAHAQALALAHRRAGGEPIAHILGRREFWSLDLCITAQVLIPRADTELLVERALAHLAQASPARVCDLGTGSGAVALALAVERPRARITASDSSLAALRVAAANAARLAPGRIAFVAGDWLTPFAAGAFDLVVGNPPYVASGDAHLERGDLRFEPRAALVSGADGLDAIRCITRCVARCLRGGGWLALEHGAQQGEAVRAAFAAAGLVALSTHRDLAGHERVTQGRMASGD